MAQRVVYSALIAFMPILSWMSWVYGQTLCIQLGVKMRSVLINDVCNGIRMIKYYCWEKPFKALVGEDVGGER